MSDYKVAKAGRLKLKGKRLPSAAGKKRSKDGQTSGDEGESSSKKVRPVDVEEHGRVTVEDGWWLVNCEEELRGGEQMVVELGKNCYLAATDTGKFTIGPPHPKGEGPSPEEILHIIKAPDTKWMAMRTGFGKYVGVDSSGRVVGNAEAVGGREKWEPVFHEGHTAFQALGNSCFLSAQTDKEGFVYASTKAAKETEMISLRMVAERKIVEDWRPAEDKLTPLQTELAYRKKYQHTKIGLNPTTRMEVKSAMSEGRLHETLLERRVKMKSDKYC